MSHEPAGYPGAPPGWYPDPAGGPGQRWWDGYAWTEAVVLPAQPPPPPSVPIGTTPGTTPGTPTSATPGTTTGTMPPGYGSPSPWYAAQPLPNAPGLFEGEWRISRMAKAAVVMPAVYFLAGLINLRLHATQYRDLGHQYQRIFQAAQHHRTTPALTIPNGLNGGFTVVTYLIGLLTIAAVVVACVWQYRAASTARALGLPAKHSPGWGVGSWFVPIVNFWMPYQAIRDCLAKDDPNRGVVRQWWFFIVGAWAFSLAAGIAALFSSGLALAFCIPGALLCLGILATAPRFVTAIGVAHRAAVRPDGSATPVSG